MLLKRKEKKNTKPLQRYRVLSFVVQRQKVSMHAVVSVCLRTRINLEETWRAQVLSLFLLALGLQACTWPAHKWKSLRSFQEWGLWGLGPGTFEQMLCRPEAPQELAPVGVSPPVLGQTGGWTGTASLDHPRDCPEWSPLSGSESGCRWSPYRLSHLQSAEVDNMTIKRQLGFSLEGRCRPQGSSDWLLLFIY